MKRFYLIHKLLNSIATDIQPKDIETFSILSEACHKIELLEHKMNSDMEFESAPPNRSVRCGRNQ